MTRTPFLPSATQPFEFQPTLDGLQYTAFVKWNVFGRRYYLELYQLDGVRVLTTALIGSPNDADINLVGGYVDSILVFRAQSQQFEVPP